MDLGILPGEVYWARPSPAVGREQAGRRPVVIVSNELYHEAVATLVLAVPVTSVDRGWGNHIAVTVGGVAGFAMTEQVRVISRHRLDGQVGVLPDPALAAIRAWITDYLV